MNEARQTPSPLWKTFLPLQWLGSHVMEYWSLASVYLLAVLRIDVGCYSQIIA